jgi:hypothetical protein
MRIDAAKIAFLLAVALGVFLLFAPSYTGTTNQPGHAQTFKRSLLEVNGPTALVAVDIPILLTAIPLFVPRLRLMAAAVLSVFAIVAGFSIGLFYVPCAILLWLPQRERA